MGRPLRIEYAGAVYHVTSRGIERREIFKDDKDREHLINLLKEGAESFKVEVIAYCLMSNHFHFLLCTKQANLNRFMQRMNSAYTRYFNYKHKRVGPLMQGRYKAILVGSDEYFLGLSRYIHLNPVKIKQEAKKSKPEQKLRLMKYKWSSYSGVLDPEKRSKYFKCERVLDFVGGNNERGRKRYEEYVQEGVISKVTNPMEELKYQFLLGSDKFINHIRETFVKRKDLKPFMPAVREIRGPSIAEIARRTAAEYDIRPEEILQARSKYKDARKVLIELGYRLCLENKTLRELGKELGGISGAGISRVHERMQEKSKMDKSLAEKITRLTESFCQ